MRSNDVTRVRHEVRQGLAAQAPLLLAVSGGLDSMCLLDAAAACRGNADLHVATFDHGTGAVARDAVTLVEGRARELEVPVHVGRAPGGTAGEAAWRAMRWQFLRSTARGLGATIVTAHTRDDQVETVLMRILRDAGARGIAGLYAESDVRHPLLATSRSDLERYAAALRLEWVEDPSNASSAFLRNRVRRDLLPALRRVRRSIDRELLDVARRAAELRREVETLVAREIPFVVRMNGRGLDVPLASMTGYSPESIAIAWPAIAAQLGVALDRRGTSRLTAFTIRSGVGSRMQLSGGWEVVRARDTLQIRKGVRTDPGAMALASEGSTSFGGGRWRFHAARDAAPSDAWTAVLPTHGLSVRRWRAGDVLPTGSGARKVKHLLSAAGITGHDRADWPVVLAGEEIVWIPGVRRSEAATERSGRPALTYRCDYDNG